LTFECAAMEDMVQHLGRQIPAWQRGARAQSAQLLQSRSGRRDQS
jgi:hypothetical protein